MEHAFKVGAQIMLTTAVPVGSMENLPEGSIGKITALGAGDHVEAWFTTRGGPRLVTLHATTFEDFHPRIFTEADDPEPDLVQAATAHLVDVLEPIVPASAAMRSIMVADVYTKLEQARQLGRIADALEAQR